MVGNTHRIRSRELLRSGVDQTHSRSEIERSGEALARERRRLRLVLNDLVTYQHRELVCLTELEVVVDGRYRTQTLAFTARKGCRLRTARITVVEVAVLRVTARERKLGAGRQTVDNLPREGGRTAERTAVRLVDDVIDHLLRVVRIVDVGDTEREARSDLRVVYTTQRVVDRLVEVSTRHIRTLTAGRRFTTVLVRLRVANIYIQVQALGELLTNLERSVHTAQIRVDLDTLVVNEVERSGSLRLLRTTRYVDRVAVREGRAEQVVRPVVRSYVGVVSVVVAILRAQAEILLNGILVGGTARSGVAPVVEYILLSREGLQLLGHLLHLHITVVGHLYRTGLGALRRHEDNTVSTTSTVDSRRRGILQHVDRLDLRSGDVRNRAYGETIHYEERVVRLRNRTTTTHAYRNLGTRTTVLRNNVYTRQFTLQGLCHIRYGVGCKFLTRHRSYGTRKVTTLYRTITDYNHLVKLRIRSCEDKIHLRLAGGYGLRYALVANVRNGQHCVLGDIERKGTVRSGRRTCRRALNNHTGTDDRLTGRIFHRTRHLGLGECKRGDAQEADHKR